MGSKILVLAILALLQCPTTARADDGGSSGNGGNTFVTPEGRALFLDLVRLPKTVIYNHKRSEAFKLLKEQLDKHEGYTQATYFPQNYNEPTESIRNRILTVLNERMQFQIIQNGSPLPDPKDTGLVVLPTEIDGKIQRLALQDPATGRVMVDGGLLDKMSDRDIAAFMEHEALIKLWYEDYQNTPEIKGKGRVRLESTDKIADIVNMTFVTNKFTQNLSAEAVSAKMCEAGIRVASKMLPGLTQLPGTGTRKFKTPEVFYAYVPKDCGVRTFKVMEKWKTALSNNIDFLDQLNLMEVVSDSRCYGAYLERMKEKGRAYNLIETNDPNGDYLEEGEFLNPRFQLWAH